MPITVDQPVACVGSELRSRGRQGSCEIRHDVDSRIYFSQVSRKRNSNSDSNRLIFRLLRGARHIAEHLVSRQLAACPGSADSTPVLTDFSGCAGMSSELAQIMPQLRKSSLCHRRRAADRIAQSIVSSPAISTVARRMLNDGRAAPLRFHTSAVQSNIQRFCFADSG